MRVNWKLAANVLAFSLPANPTFDESVYYQTDGVLSMGEGWVQIRQRPLMAFLIVDGNKTLSEICLPSFYRRRKTNKGKHRICPRAYVVSVTRISRAAFYSYPVLKVVNGSIPFPLSGRKKWSRASLETNV